MSQGRQSPRPKGCLLLLLLPILLPLCIALSFSRPHHQSPQPLESVVVTRGVRQQCVLSRQPDARPTRHRGTVSASSRDIEETHTKSRRTYNKRFLIYDTNYNSSTLPFCIISRPVERMKITLSHTASILSYPTYPYLQETEHLSKMLIPYIHIYTIKSERSPLAEGEVVVHE